MCGTCTEYRPPFLGIWEGRGEKVSVCEQGYDDAGHAVGQNGVRRLVPFCSQAPVGWVFIPTHLASLSPFPSSSISFRNDMSSSPAEEAIAGDPTPTHDENQTGGPLLPSWLTGRLDQYFGKWPAFQLAAWCTFCFPLPLPFFILPFPSAHMAGTDRQTDSDIAPCVQYPRPRLLFLLPEDKQPGQEGSC